MEMVSELLDAWKYDFPIICEFDTWYQRGTTCGTTCCTTRGVVRGTTVVPRMNWQPWSHMVCFIEILTVFRQIFVVIPILIGFRPPEHTKNSEIEKSCFWRFLPL